MIGGLGCVPSDDFEFLPVQELDDVAVRISQEHLYNKIINDAHSDAKEKVA